MARAPRQQASSVVVEGTIDQPPAPRPFTVMGTAGLRQAAGFVWEEFEPDLRGDRAVRTYERMATDPTVSAVFYAIEAVLRGVGWEVEPAKEPGSDPGTKPSKEAAAGADFVRMVLFEDMMTPWPEIIAEALSCLIFGYSLHELIWEKRDDKRVGLRDISPRPQSTVVRWLFDEDGELTGVVQRHPVSGREIPIPMGKLLHFKVRSAKRNPEGVSLFRSAYTPWVRAVNLSNIEGIGLERDLAGLPVARVPRELMTQAAGGDVNAQMQLQEYVRMVRDLRRNEQSGVILPSDPWPTPDGSGVTAARMYDFELLSANSTGAAINTAITRNKAEIATSVLADFMLLGQSATGSWALSTDKTELFLQSLKAILDHLAAEFQVIIRALWALNGFPNETRPKLRPGPIAPVAVEKLAANLAQLAGAGMRLFPDTAMENQLRSMMGLPPLTEETMAAAEADAAAMTGMDDTEGDGAMGAEGEDAWA